MSSYKISIRIYQSNTGSFFRVVEKTCWNYANGGTWDEYNGEHILTMGGSGTSGTIRVKNDDGEECIFALGVHNYKRWCDAVPDATGEDKDTGMIVNAAYYNGGKRSSQREKQLTEWTRKSTNGRAFTVRYTVTDGNALRANIIIG